jgi:hypothetical protein
MRQDAKWIKTPHIRWHIDREGNSRGRGRQGQGQREAHRAMTWSCSLQMMPFQLADLGPPPAPPPFIVCKQPIPGRSPFSPPAA